jgi:chemotaxis protein MotB
MAGLLLAFILILMSIQLVTSKKIGSKNKTIRDQHREIEQLVDPEELEDRRERIERERRDIEKMEDRVSSVLGIRTKLMRRLKQRFSRVGGEIKLDDATGSIRLGSRILFGEGEWELTPKGKQKLESLMPIYFEALLGSPELRKHVGQIIFEGHTNSNYTGPGGERKAYLGNLRLSQKRAFNAMRYVLEKGIGSEYDVRQLLQASGFSYSDRIYRRTEAGRRVEDKVASRRIEIRFRLKEEKALRELRRMFRENLNKPPSTD